MSESKDTHALIAGLRALEERQAPASVRRQVAERLGHTLFSAKPEGRLWPVFRLRLAPLSIALVVVGTTGVLWASVHVVRAVWSAKAELELPVQPETRVAPKVSAAPRKLSQRNGSPLPAVLAAPAAQLLELPASSPASLTLAAKPALAEHVAATQQLAQHAYGAARTPNRPAVAAFELPSAAVQPTPQLKQERAILDRARAFIRAGNGHAADQALAEHSARFAAGRHAEEREALRVFSAVLRSAGESRAAALSFHGKYPHSLFWRGIAKELGIQ